MKAIIQFLKELKDNNNREWFSENKNRYEENKNKIAFITQLLVAEIRKFDETIPMLEAKDCMYRIYRDARFSMNKDPYKTNFGTEISKGGRKSVFAGYYLHIEPGASFIGGGVWCPEPKVLKAVREEIYRNPKDFKNIIDNKNFSAIFPNIEGEKLKVAPKGFDKDFVDIDLLRYKSYTFINHVTDKEVCSDNFINEVINKFKTLYKANRFINDAIEDWLE